MESTTIQALVALEWDRFNTVQNQGGRASCQDDYPTFNIMRTSQFKAWTQEMMDSYAQDLQEATAQGRNLLAEKYGYMMERTAPLDYLNIAHLLPQKSDEKEDLIGKIETIHATWCQVMCRDYPLLMAMGRPATKEDDSLFTSVETYLWGELATYSEATLRLYLAHVEDLQANGENLNAQILTYTVQSYGFDSLDSAESHLNPSK